ncbi:hypothetical protein SAMN05216249_12823 [Acetitomaculum ruminis DSM 5522]|uniref:Uncharacterized protein n=1 Tax=Acetitomaculum ruminis DSM 5522 TaxID=1120918 RepID=A0A1I1AIS8_9FIRM|nr:hypothetical protein [Acetitomaculum ruminis]SFB37837.1 hypothetical protein SAMN05216249_12823 [Acetitomaculum ruminis DSM 5522]
MKRENNFYLKLWGQYKYDFTNELANIIKWLCGLMIYIMFDCILFSINTLNMEYPGVEYMGKRCYLWKILGGELFFETGSKDIKVCVEYLVIGTVLIFIITGYLKKDLKENGYRNILYASSKNIWLISKYLLSLTKAIFFSLICLLTIYFNILLEGTNFFKDNKDVFTVILGYGAEYIKYEKVALIIFFMSALAFSLIYTALEFLLEPLYVFILGIIYWICSYFVNSIFFAADNFMLVRVAYKIESGISKEMIWLPMWLLAFGLVLISFFTIRKKDIM